MSKLYAVIQLNHEKRFNYRYNELRVTCQPCIPYVFDRYDVANKKAEEKRKAHVTALVVEFPFNPLDKKVETMEAKIKADADYIAHLESVIDELGIEVEDDRR